MRKLQQPKVWLIAATILAAASAAVGVRWSLAGRLSLPAKDEVAGITARIDDVGPYMSVIPVAEFRLPQKYIGVVLAALGSPEGTDDRSWGKKIALPVGVLKITTKQGRTITVQLFAPGKYKACYSVDGVRCQRAGSYKPVVVGGRDENYTDESTLLCDIIQLICQEQNTGQTPKELRREINDLERSRGQRPPEQDS